MSGHVSRPSLLVGIVAAVLALGACGDDDEEQPSGRDTAAESAPAEAPPAETAPAEEPPGAPAGDPEDLGSKPEVEIPSGEPPSKLEIDDIVEGDGAEAETGQSVTVQYVGVAHSTKQEFDASWDRGEPFTFDLGSGMVIPGWEEGIPGMKVGGRRRLTIPPDLAYGESGFPPAIGPNETLVFVIDLLEAG